MLPLHRTTSSNAGSGIRFDADDFKGVRRSTSASLSASFGATVRRRVSRPVTLIAILLVFILYSFLRKNTTATPTSATENSPPLPPAAPAAPQPPLPSLEKKKVTPNNGAEEIPLRSLDWSVLEDSRSLPLPPSQFSHNFPPFLSSMDSILDEHRKKVWDARADAVSRALSHAWDGYLKYAWNSDELKPVSKSGDSWLHMGLTIIDALDTAWVLGNKTIFDKAVDWVVREKGLTMDADVNANVFETTIRVVGGLLSAYDLSKDDRLFKEAVRVADKFLPAFDTTSGIPFNSINLKSGKATNPGGTYSSTSEATTVQLEMKYLSHLTGDPKYWNAAQKVSKVLFQSPSDKTDKYDGLVPVYLDKTSGNFIGTELRLGSRADSYYEYLAKQYLQTNETEPFFLQQYRKALHKGIKKHLLMRSEPSNLLYIREYNGNLGSGTISEKFDHLVCYFGGTLALTATKGKRVPTDIEGRKKVLTGIEMEELYLGEELARSCYEMYHQTATGLASEIVFWKPAKDQVGTKKEFERTWSRFESFNSEAEAKESTKTKADLPIALELVRDVTHDDLEHDFSIHPMDLHNLLRPEAIETFFVLYRITGDEKYREWGWRMFRSFEQWTKVETGGYTSLNNVMQLPPPTRDKMESFFLGETLKYFYLLFADSSLIPLDKYVFNTECHPLPIFQVSEELKKKIIWM